MSLEWKGAPGNVIARGQRGTYTIQSLSTGEHVLQGIGNDDKPMVASLGFLGRAFRNIDAAKNYADELDCEDDDDYPIGDVTA